MQTTRFDTSSQWVPGPGNNKTRNIFEISGFSENFREFQEIFRIFLKISGISGFFGTFPGFRDIPENFQNFGNFRKISGISGFPQKFPEFRVSLKISVIQDFPKISEIPEIIPDFFFKISAASTCEIWFKKTRFHTRSPPPPPGMPTLFF